MKEREYIEVSNMRKIEAAANLLRDVIDSEMPTKEIKSKFSRSRADLCEIVEKLRKRIKIEED